MNNKSLHIKVCGITDKTNIGKLIQLPVDYLGFIFYEKSPRYVNTAFIKHIAELPSSIQKTGVFVNSSVDYIQQMATLCKLDCIQLHGNESPAFCNELRKTNIPIIKAFSICDSINADELSRYADHCDYFLFDTKCNGFGGSGKKYNWQLLKTYNHPVPFFLSGGISPDDAPEILSLYHPMLYGIDINSLFEIAPGYKDLALIVPFIEKLKQRHE